MKGDKRKIRQLKNRKTILTYMMEKGIVIQSENIFHAEKAFVVNSVLAWCVKKCDDGEYTTQDVRFYFDSIDQYIRGELSISWDENGSLVIGG